MVRTSLISCIACASLLVLHNSVEAISFNGTIVQNDTFEGSLTNSFEPRVSSEDCDEGLECCDSQCVDLQSDLENCGACNVVCCDPTPICIGGGCSSDCSPECSTECSIPTATVTTTTTTTLFGTTTATSITTATEPTTITDIVTTTKPTTITEPTTTTATVVTITTTTQAICPLGGIPCGQQCCTNGSTCDQNTQLCTCTDDSQCNPGHVCLAGECCPDNNVCPSTPTCCPVACVAGGCPQ